MDEEPPQNEPHKEAAGSIEVFPAVEPPFLRAPERARTVFTVIFIAACGPLLCGLVLFGWRAGVVAGISIASCALIERGYYFVTRTPALLGRSHAYLTGLLLALTLPPYVPWYVPVVAAGFAIVIGKGIFGGVGHFIWQPALVGRLAVAVMFPTLMTTAGENLSGVGPVLGQNRLLVGDIRNTRYVRELRSWRGRMAPDGADGFLTRKPDVALKGLTSSRGTVFSALAYRPVDVPRSGPVAFVHLPVISDLIFGARPGGIGETCAVAVIICGLYLVYRNYVKLHLPAMFVISAALVAAVAPIRFAAPHDTVVKVWYPIATEGFDTGLVYVSYQLLSGELILAGFFLATEMTTRPVTLGGQVIFAVCGGAVAMLLKLYVDTPIPAYMGVLAVNTIAQSIDTFWRPRVLGQKHFAFLPWRRR